MISQKKLAEDVGFYGADLGTLMDAFSMSFFGSDLFYE